VRRLAAAVLIALLTPLRSRGGRRWILLILVGLLAAGGGVWLWHSRLPAVRVARYLVRAERHIRQEQLREAVIEYRNVLRVAPGHRLAVRQLGLVHFQLGELRPAFPYLLAAKERDPGDLPIRLMLGRVYLMGNAPANARQEAAFVLEREPRNADALVLLSGASRTPEEIDTAIRRMEAVTPGTESPTRLRIALADLYRRKRDVPAAERLLREAVAREPTSVEAHLALGTLYAATSDAARAERELQAAAELAPLGSPARMRLADFYLGLRRVNEAKRILVDVTTRAPAYLPAWRRLAEIALAERRYDEALGALAPVFAQDRADLDGRLLRSRIRLAKGETTAAIEELQSLVRAEPRLAPMRYQLALAYVQAGQLQQAKTELREVMTTAPDLTDATLRLAELNIRTGAAQLAIDDVEKLVARRPDVVEAHALLGAAYLARGKPARAAEAYRRFRMLAPRDPRGPYLVGLGLRAEGKLAEAKRELEAALALDPSHVDALAQLAAIAVAEKQPDAAVNRIRTQIARVQGSAGFRYLLGNAQEARGDPTAAEAAYREALEREPGFLAAYVRLGRLYAAKGQYDWALGQLGEVLRVDPKNPVALMLSGVVLEQQGDIRKAQEAYERILAVNSRFAPAANNLAWLCSEHGGDLERALQLARTAREAAPVDPRIADTLGWILYKRGIYGSALALLKESAAKLPDEPVVQYHLGMAHGKVGDKDEARRALAVAIKGGAFPGRQEAERALAELR
jgi:tetratricopeptide (TPR) repeat protein